MDSNEIQIVDISGTYSVLVQRVQVVNVHVCLVRLFITDYVYT